MPPKASAVTVSIEAPDQPEILALLAQSDAFTADTYPEGASAQVGLAGLTQPEVRFMVARLDGEAVGCGALVLSGERTAELRRMIVDAAHRGQGIGRAVLDALEATARQEAVRMVRLETGPRNHDALVLYRRYGYHERGPFGDYAENPNSVFMEKALPA